MIKNIAYYPAQCALNSTDVIQAFIHSCKAVGIRPIENSLDCDAVVIWSVLWKGRMQANKKVYEHYRSLNKPVVVIDVGALHRGVTWKIAVNNINANGYYSHKHSLDPDRPAKLGIALQTRINSSPNIVIASQHVKSEQVAGVDLGQWIERTVQEINKHTDRLVVVRHHPRCLIPYNGTVETPQKIPGTYDSFNIDFGCHAMINYNSGPGIQAALAGCPVITDTSSLAYPVSIRIDEIENPPEVDKEKWLIEICHTEYTVQEIQQGLWLKRLGDSL